MRPTTPSREYVDLAQRFNATSRWHLRARWGLMKQIDAFCPWCRGSRIFSDMLPMACPSCDGTGQRKPR